MVDVSEKCGILKASRLSSFHENKKEVLMKVFLFVGALFLLESCGQWSPRYYFYNESHISVHNDTGREIDIFHQNDLKTHMFPDEETIVIIRRYYEKKHCLVAKIRSEDSISFIQKCIFSDWDDKIIIFDKEDFRNRHSSPL